MCNPLAVVGMQAMGGINSAIGAYGQAKGQQSLLSHEANMAEINAGLAERAAQTEILRGQLEERKVRLNTAGLKGSQRAGIAASGIDLGEGSALNVLTTTDVLGEIDANITAANAVRSAWGYEIQRTGYENEARMKRATRAGINPGMAAFNSLLGSAGQVASSWYGMSKVGGNSGGGGGGGGGGHSGGGGGQAPSNGPRGK